MMHLARKNWLLLVAIAALVISDQSVAQSQESPSEEQIEPWDFSPYKVLVWVVSDDPKLNAATLERPLRIFLDREFSSIWRVSIADAPISVRTGAKRNIDSLDYDTLVSSDPVIALKRNHKDAIRIRIATNVGKYVNKVHGYKSLIDDVKERGAEKGSEALDGAASKLEAVEPTVSLQEKWADETTEALIVPRGYAQTLTEPEAKLIPLPVTRLVDDSVKKFDKIYVVRIDQSQVPSRAMVSEFECLMHYFGPVVTSKFLGAEEAATAVGHALTEAFSPVVRIENAGTKTATGLVRAIGLAIDKDSPARIKVDDVLVPMVRKNDRNGRPIMIGPMDWAYLVGEEIKGPILEMGFYAGRTGGLQGRKNKRTFRIALKVRPPGDDTVVRLHVKGDKEEPLIGYELYEKELKSKNMTFIGRTNWNGTLRVSKKPEHALRLMYVKNGGAVLARLPLVPGLTVNQVADLTGDDIRLQAEAYIRGVENSIIDLVAVRKLFVARIRLRLERGEMDQAKELMELLRAQPSNESLANEMGKRNTRFQSVKGISANQKAKIDNMFKSTRNMLTKMITAREINELEDDFVTAERNGGRLPIKRNTEEEVDPNANDVSRETEDKKDAAPKK